MNESMRNKKQIKLLETKPFHLKLMHTDYLFRLVQIFNVYTQASLEPKR